MTTVDLHSESAITAAGLVLPTKSIRLALDESWSPYVQANLVCPLPADLDDLDSVDPRTVSRFLVTMRRDFGLAWSNGDFTARHGVGTNAALTSVYGSMTNGAITAQFFVPFNTFGVRATDQREANLHVRSRVIDHVAKEVRITLASDEALLQDYALVALAKYINTFTSLRSLVADVIGLIGATLQTGTDDAVIVAGAEWLPGVSAWDYLSPLIETADLRLWCDESRHWWLTQRSPLVAGHLALATGEAGTITDATDTIDRDGEFYDAVVITYKWTDTLGAQQIAWDVAGAGYTRVLSETREQIYPGPGAAAGILKRAEGRGRVLDIAAVSDYTATPGQAFTASLPDTVDQTGIVSAVTWEAPAAEMRVRTRGLIDTPTTAWVFDPPGLSWDSIPVGVDWTEDI